MCIIWTMKEYGDSSSWTKWLDINLYDRVHRLIGFRKESDLLIQISEKLCSFDHKEAGGKEINIMSELDLRVWNLLQQDHKFKDYLYFGEEVYYYDPKAAPKDFNIQRKVDCSYDKPFYCESYIESLALIGKSSVTADQCPIEKSVEKHIGVQRKIQDVKGPDIGTKQRELSRRGDF